ncbi:hypothetical protein CKG00_09095 [Morganella morganii]|uniref:Uncharacterized protein n=1 Tax=Morganella morganii TaxID=582 RepID=A0A433ZWK8_MORMO|nr:hypothetical protein [Morganella morganii]RUT66528.1 hypothetical protein CKG00_09095 [Morganella morganii]
MATTPTQTDILLSIPFNAATDFIALAEHCQNIIDALAESPELPLRIALYARLTACLALLQPTLNDPIPPRLQQSLTVSTPPNRTPRFDPESEPLCDYCHTLAQLLTSRVFLPEMEIDLNNLLYELVIYFSDEIRAPRWIRTASGVEFIDGGDA